MIKTRNTILTLLALGTSGVSASETDKLAYFHSKVLPLLEETCYKCHSHESGKSKGGLMLDSAKALRTGGNSGDPIVPGKPEESLLYQAVAYLDEDMEMPPKKQLPAEQIAIFKKWIEMGAPDPRESPELPTAKNSDHWSLQAMVRHDPPKVSNPERALTDVDHFLLSKLDEAQLPPVKDAPDRLLIRRLFLDLTGLPPTPDELTDWLEKFSSSKQESLTTLADHLMARSQFGERWARHWLDTARYAESNGNNRNRVFRYAWRYRNWVIDSHNEDQPYDDFLKHQLAGDLMDGGTSDDRKKRRIATGFLAIGSKPYFPTIVPFDPEEPDRARYDWAAEQIDATMSGMMGMTVGCARCHDHKTDPIPTADYYALAGIFRSTEPRFGMWHHLFGVGEGQVQRDFLYDWNLLVLNDELLEKIIPLQEKYQPLVAEEHQIILHQRHWPEQIKRQEKRLAEGKNLTPELIANLKKNIAERSEKLAQEAKRLPEIRKQKEELKKAFSFEVDQAIGVEDGEKPADVHLRLAGEHHKRGRLVPRGFPTAVQFEGGPEGINPKQSGRLELAEWIAHPNNPLTARVAVNRIWYHLFGRGLVNTLDNFGVSGEQATHPELLDFLAHKFVHEFSWSRKKLIRYLVGSRAYQLASAESLATPKHFDLDPQNSLYWRATPRRLDAESIRDSMLAVSGRLSLERPKSSPLVTFEYHADVTHPDRLKALAELSGNLRTIYVPTLRGHRHRLYDLFDYPDDEAVNSARATTTVPTQALFLMNNSLVMDLAGDLAKRVETITDEKDRIARLYQLCFGREATASEIESDLSFIKEHDWTSLAHSLLLSNEFLFRL